MDRGNQELEVLGHDEVPEVLRHEEEVRLLDVLGMQG